MLASDEESDSLGAMSFSLASDIVELVVLTRDAAFLHTLRDAVGSSRRVWHVPSADKVGDLLVAGQVGILVLDAQALYDAAGAFVAQIKRQFPDLVVVVAGHRESETSLGALISAGLVYRFIHKPMSPGRAKLFADAAVKRYDEQRKRLAMLPRGKVASHEYRHWAVAGFAAIAIAAAVFGILQHGARTPTAPAPLKAAPESPLLARAAAALADNRLTAPAGDNALDLYSQALLQSTTDAAARAGVAEVRERLLARAENALIEERLDEAASAIDVAQKAGVPNGRVAFLGSQLTKARERQRAASLSRSKTDAHSTAAPGDDRVSQILSLAAERRQEGHLIEPERDSERFYVQEALRLEPDNESAQAAEQALAMALLSEAHGAIERRDFARAVSLLDASNGIASPANIDSVLQVLRIARKQAEADAWDQLLRNADERVQQDRLVEPANDSAKYYLSTLRTVDPNHPGLAGAIQNLGDKLVAKARRALALQQYDAARSWLDEAGAMNFYSAELAAALRDLDGAVQRQKFLSTVVAASDLTLVKSVKPVYPKRAEQTKVEGWVELDFTVGESGEVKDVALHAADPAGVFDAAAAGALLQWRYSPVLRDAKPAEQRARIRMRFNLRG